MENTININVLKTHQSEWNMYVGVISATDLYSIAEVDRVRLESLQVPKYAGYQRALDQSRVNSIRDYLKTPDCTFPNSVIVTIDSECIEKWDEMEGGIISIIKISNEKGAIRIVDGQHRGAALDSAPKDFEVIITIFIDLDIVKCAQIFAKINSTQRAVNPSIAFQLFGYSDARSPQKTAHEIAEVLNTTQGSPFYKRLRMLGTKDDWSNGVLSQSTFCKHLMSLYTNSWEKDEYKILRGEKLDDISEYPLRKYFINGKDKEILQIIWKYFYIIAETWKDQWDITNEQSILFKTTGFASLIQVLKQWLLKEEGKFDETLMKKSLASIKSNYESPNNIFIRNNYPAGHQGVVPLRNSLLKDLNLNEK